MLGRASRLPASALAGAETHLETNDVVENSNMARSNFGRKMYDVSHYVYLIPFFVVFYYCSFFFFFKSFSLICCFCFEPGWP